MNTKYLIATNGLVEFNHLWNGRIAAQIHVFFMALLVRLQMIFAMSSVGAVSAVWDNGSLAPDRVPVRTGPDRTGFLMKALNAHVPARPLLLGHLVTRVHVPLHVGSVVGGVRALGAVVHIDSRSDS